MQGKLIGPNYLVSQMAVLEDNMLPSWSQINRPPIIAQQHYLLYSMNHVLSDGTERTYFPRCLYAREVMDVFMRLNELVYQDIPIEVIWFEDAQLPLEVIDGVPESPQHYQVQNRFEEEYGRIYPIWGDEPFCLEDPREIHLREEYHRIEGGQM